MNPFFNKLFQMLLVLLVAQGIALGQDIKVFFKVVDTNNKNIPYVSVTLNKHQIGVYSDSLGNVSFSFPKSKADTLCINAMGYTQKKYFWKNVPLTVILIEQDTEIGTATIIGKQGKSYQKMMGEYKKGFKKHQLTTRGVKGDQYAFFLENSENKEGFIKSIYLNTWTDKTSTGNKIRIRIFDKNPITQTPNKDLMTETIIYEVTSAGILELNVEKYNIVFPKNGCFIGIDLLGKDTSKPKEKVLPGLYGYYPRSHHNNSSQGYWIGFMDNGKWFSSNRIKTGDTGNAVLYIAADIIYYKD